MTRKITEIKNRSLIQIGKVISSPTPSQQFVRLIRKNGCMCPFPDIKVTKLFRIVECNFCCIIGNIPEYIIIENESTYQK